MRGCDFAWLPAGLDLHKFARQLKADGFEFVVRYLSYDPSKNLSRAEVDAYKRAGLHIVTVWEATADAALGGAAQGMADAKAAKELLHELGAPEHAPVYFACDFPVSPDQMPVIDAYLDATAFVLSMDLNGVYGSYTATGARHVRYRWQTVAWSNGLWRKVSIRQPGINSGDIDGVGWDIDEAMRADFGQWEWPNLRHAKPRKPRKQPVRKVVHKTRHVVQKEPVLASGALLSFLTALVTFIFPHLGWHIYHKQLAVVLTALVTLAGAGATLLSRPIRVGAFSTFGAAVATASATFGLHLPSAWVGGQMPLVSLAAALLVRSHVSPKTTYQPFPASIASRLSDPIPLTDMVSVPPAAQPAVLTARTGNQPVNTVI